MNTVWKNTFIAFISFALFFHVLNTLQITSGIKVFHLFTVGAFIVGLLISGRNSDAVVKVFIAFICWTAFSALLSPVSVSFLSGIKFLLITLSAFFILRVPINRFILVFNCFIPIILFILVVHYLNERPLYRYQGFYDDPNYLCTTLLVLLFFILLFWEKKKNTFIRVLLALEILCVAVLITTSISRSGLLCLAFILIGFFWDLIKENGVISIAILLLSIGSVLYFDPDFFNNAIAGYILRETENSDTVYTATEFRKEISMRGINYIAYHPRFFFQGMGIGSYTNAYELPEWTAPTTHIDHNTFTSCFSEQGFIGLILYVSFLFLLFKNIRSNQYLIESGLRRVCIVTLFSFLLFSISINQMSYLPFWALIMVLLSLSQNSKSEVE